MDMWSAVSLCNESEVTELLEKGLCIDERQKDGHTYLMRSATCSNCSIVRMLIEAGCPINATDNRGNTALHLSVFHLNYHVACELIKSGADVLIKNKFKYTPLHLAVVNLTHINLIEEIIPNGIQLNEKNAYFLDTVRFAEEYDIRCMSAIKRIIASKQNYRNSRITLVKALLNAGANVNAMDINNCTPVHTAVYTGDLELVKMLIKAGANVNIQNLIRASALHNAIICRNDPMVILLLCYGANVAATTVHGNTALHWASMLTDGRSHANIMKDLLMFGSDVNKLNADDLTPFHILLKNGSASMVNLFATQHNLDVMELDSYGMTALHYAACNPDTSVIKLLLQKFTGIVIDKKGRRGLTALHIASQESKPGNVRELIAKGADVNAEDNYGNTVLFLTIAEAFQSRHVNRPLAMTNRKIVLQLLLDHGADLNKKYFYYGFEKTSLQVVIEEMNCGLRNVIIKHVVRVEAATKKQLLDDFNMMIIKSNKKSNIVYNSCQEELKKMSNFQFEDISITHLSMLTRSEDELVSCLRNNNLLEKFEASYIPSAYPYYGYMLQNKFDAAVAKRNKIEKVCGILSELFRDEALTDHIIETICKYLREEDADLLIATF